MPVNYSQEDKDKVRSLLEAGCDVGSTALQTGVSDRTVKRWVKELGQTGRIGKPPESRTGRKPLIPAGVEQAMFAHVDRHAELSLDDISHWLHEKHKIITGQRTIRRALQRRNGNNPQQQSQGDDIPDSANNEDDGVVDDDDDDVAPLPERDVPAEAPSTHQSPYNAATAPTAVMSQQGQTMARAVQRHTPQTPASQRTVQQRQVVQPQHTAQPPQHQSQASVLPDDEETIQLELQQIQIEAQQLALMKREVALKLQLRRMQQSANMPPPQAQPQPQIASTPSLAVPVAASSPALAPTTGLPPKPPKRDSRSKAKQAKAKRDKEIADKKALEALELRRRKREYITAEWVASKFIWPLPAQRLLARLMKENDFYVVTSSNSDMFEDIYRRLYTLVDLKKGNWNPQTHDEMLRDRIKRKIEALRRQMLKKGEIKSRQRDSNIASTYVKVNDYTGPNAGDSLDNDVDDSMQDDAQDQADAGAQMSIPQPTPAQYQQHQQNHQHLGHQQMQYEMQAANLHNAQHHQQAQMNMHAQMNGQPQQYPDPTAFAQHSPTQYPTMNAQHAAMMGYPPFAMPGGGMGRTNEIMM